MLEHLYFWYCVTLSKLQKYFKTDFYKRDLKWLLNKRKTKEKKETAPWIWPEAQHPFFPPPPRPKPALAPSPARTAAPPAPRSPSFSGSHRQADPACQRHSLTSFLLPSSCPAGTPNRGKQRPNPILPGFSSQQVNRVPIKVVAPPCSFLLRPQASGKP